MRCRNFVAEHIRDGNVGKQIRQQIFDVDSMGALMHKGLLGGT